MNILVIGQGGREHAIIKALRKSPRVDKIYCAPGNGGIENDAICIPIKENDFSGLVEMALQNRIDLTVVGPENPLLEGIVDYFEKKGLKIVGPSKLAAQIEGSKSFAKELMRKYNIPTADYRVFNVKEEAIRYIKDKGAPIVIKADGLAAGKGVIVATSLNEAIEAIEEIMEKRVFGEAGNRVVIEEFLQGEELTVMAFVDGTTVLPMEPAQDHKQVYDYDKGPNTGGMGTYSPVPHIKQELLTEIKESILFATVAAMKEEGYSFSGILYAGLMLTEDGPKVIEFNARFGDPETQVVLPRLKTDLVDVLLAIQEKRLNEIKLKWDSDAAICVIMAAGGYPRDYKKGIPIVIKNLGQGIEIYMAGVKKEQGQLLTSGGRVLGVTALAKNIQYAREKVYQEINHISFEDAHYRTDIGLKAIE